MARRSLLLLVAVLLQLVVARVVVAQAADEIPLQVKRWLAAGDTSQAVPWLAQASAEGNVLAAFTLGKLYRLGKAGPRDLQKSAKYLRVAAQGNVVDAQYLLALQLEREGLRADAQKWFRAAAVQGHKHAARKVSRAGHSSSADAFELIDQQMPATESSTEVDWSVVNGKGETTLSHAVRSNKVRWVEYLAGALSRQHLDRRDKIGNTALHYAAQAGSVSFLAPILNAGANPNNKNVHGSTSLHLAVAAGDAKAARMLLAHGADATIKDNNGWSSRMLAERSDSAKLAFIAGRKVDRRAQINDANIDLEAQLFLAVRQAEQQRVSDILNAGADIGAVDANGWGVMPRAVLSDCLPCFDLLLAAGADVNQRSPGNEPLLLLAARMGKQDIARRLVLTDSNIEQIDAEGRSPIWWAVAKQLQGLVLDLTERGVAMDVDEEGIGPLHLAVKGKNTVILDAVLGQADHQDVQAKTRSGNTPLLLAGHHDNAYAVRKLLARGIDIDQLNSNGDTALMVAVNRKNLASATVLVAQGASLNRRNQQNVSARSMMKDIDDAAWIALLDEAPSELGSFFERLTKR